MGNSTAKLWNGFLLVDKPAGLTSHDVVAKIRRFSHQRRVGHTGTLDPMATGLMVVLLGSATRLEPYLTKMDKAYSGRVEFGLTSDTDDGEGQVTRIYSGPWPDQTAVQQALDRHKGGVQQIPPAYSAIKVNGQRAYQAARSGQPLELKARQVTAHDLKILAYQPPELDFWADVSSGYYIRALSRDLGATLGIGGVLTALRRERVGPWSVDQAVTLGELEQWGELEWSAGLWPPAAALPHWPEIILNSDQVLRFTQGQCLAIDEIEEVPDQIKILTPKGQLLGLGRMDTDNASFGGPTPRKPFLRPLRVFNLGE